MITLDGTLGITTPAVTDTGTLSVTGVTTLTGGLNAALPVLSGGTGVTTSTGSGANVLGTSPTLVTPLLGTPTSGNLANCTGIPAPAALSTASGSAPSYSCRAWVNFNGTGTVAIRGSANVSSITDGGVGNYTVNFTTAMVDANYAMTASGVFTTSASDYKLTFYPVATPATTTTLQVRSTAASSDGAIDAVINCCSIFR
jgi:hypothetical protein